MRKLISLQPGFLPQDIITLAFYSSVLHLFLQLITLSYKYGKFWGGNFCQFSHYFDPLPVLHCLSNMQQSPGCSGV